MLVCLQVRLQIMSAEQMDRACSNLKNTEKRQGQLQKQRAKALAQLQAAEVGPRPALHASCCIRRDEEANI